jgi:peptidoglycan/LPS O-acetylase OafA/YrhL
MGFIRFLLAISVICTHYYPNFLGFSLFGRDIAINAFFIISGFYMTLIISEKYNLKRNSYWTYITNRFLRIFPIYWIILILTIITNYYWYHINYFLQRNFIDILSDFTLLFRTDYLNVNALFGNFPTVLIAWTLVIELTFYLIAPFIVKRKLWIIISLILLSIIVKYSIAYSQMLSHTYERSGFFLASLCFFLFGVLSYRIYVRIKNYNISRKLSITLLLTIVFITVFWKYIPSIFSYHQFYLKDWIFFLFLTITIPPIFIIFKSNLVEQLLAKISYPVYLSHFLLGSFIYYYSNLKGNSFPIFLIIVITTIIFSLLLTQFIDNPIDKFRQKRIQ